MYYISFFAVALIALDIGLYLIVRQTLLNGADSELRLAAQLIQQDFKTSSKNVRAYTDQDRLVIVLNSPQLRGFGGTNLYVQVYQNDGDLGGISPNLQQATDIQHSMRINPSQLQEALEGKDVLVKDAHLDDARIRELIVPLRFINPVSKQEEVAGAVQIARSMQETDTALKALFYALFGGGVVVLLAAARGGTWLTRAAFRPIDELTHTAQSIVRAEDLSRRVPVPLAQDELQRLTVTINDLLGRLDGLFSAQRRFVADVSHELRTPLAAMQGNLEILERGAVHDPQMRDESLADMRREVNRLIRMVNDLLLLARSEAGVQLRHEPVELDTLLLEVHRELRPLAGGVKLRLGHEDQVVVTGDRDRIKQALLNLGINAIQHTPPGGVVTLSLSDGDDGAQISVADTGSGISADELPLIFERFYRVDRARSGGGGAGLGLAIVKWIAEAHGGSVTVASAPGQGSTFTLHLPLHSEATPIVLQSIHTRQKVA